MIYSLTRCSSLLSPMTVRVCAFSLSLSSSYAPSFYLSPPIVLRLRWPAAGTIDFKIRRRTACAPSPPPVVPSSTSFSSSYLFSQCHRCGGTGDRPREHGPGGSCNQHRRVVIVDSLSRSGTKRCFSWRRARCAAGCEETALRHAQVRTNPRLHPAISPCTITSFNAS